MKVKYREGKELHSWMHLNDIEPYLYVSRQLSNDDQAIQINLTKGFCAFIAEYLCKKDTDFCKKMVEYFGDTFVELNKKG